MKTKGWMGTVALAALLGATGCSKNEGDGGGGGGSSNASKLEEYAMTPEWINYATAVSSELLDDCVGLWASWNGPSGIPDEDWNRRFLLEEHDRRRRRLRPVHEDGQRG